MHRCSPTYTVQAPRNSLFTKQGHAGTNPPMPKAGESCARIQSHPFITRPGPRPLQSFHRCHLRVSEEVTPRCLTRHPESAIVDAQQYQRGEVQVYYHYYKRRGINRCQRQTYEHLCK
ncbi:unnamed protein product [Periconia digitata]|uniref:Uncharacterized protein n=1 Tax=Periconia digitata TaxID=1303443 RepID=A0A9W4UDV6_9PLEO|nr:unnamed protein product [Periconia digitata]